MYNLKDFYNDSTLTNSKVEYDITISNLMNIIITNGDLNAFFYLDNTNTIANLKHNLSKYFKSLFMNNFLPKALAKEYVINNISEIALIVEPNKLCELLQDSNFQLIDAIVKCECVNMSLDFTIDMLSDSYTLSELFPTNYCDIDTRNIIENYFKYWNGYNENGYKIGGSNNDIL